MALMSRVIDTADLAEILEFEDRKMREVIPDETERMLAGWSSRSRKEALEHYIPIGWSFLVRETLQASAHSPEGLLLGYFIAQPLLFIDGQTQTLWIESLSYLSLQARDELCLLAQKLGREKHLQRVYFPNQHGIVNGLTGMKYANWQPNSLYIKTTKAIDERIFE